MFCILVQHHPIYTILIPYRQELSIRVTLNFHPYVTVEIVCQLLAGKGRGNLLTFCPNFVTNTTRRSQRLHDYDPANHLRFQRPCDLRSLDRFIHGWQVTAVECWNNFLQICYYVERGMVGELYLRMYKDF